jgi:hypothetical protein
VELFVSPERSADNTATRFHGLLIAFPVHRGLLLHCL